MSGLRLPERRLRPLLGMRGAVGVSGAPSGELDEQCARAGIAAVADDLEMSM